MAKFKHNHKKWDKVLEYKNKHNLSFAENHKIIKHTNDFSFIKWNKGIYAFPNLEKFNLKSFQKKSYIDCNISIDLLMVNQATIMIWGHFPKIIPNAKYILSYGIFLGRGSKVNLDDNSVKNKVLKEIV